MKNSFIIFIVVLVTFQIIYSFDINNIKKTNGFNEKEIIHWDFGSYIRPENKSVQFGLVIFSPTKPGKYPVIIFNSGFDGLVFF